MAKRAKVKFSSLVPSSWLDEILTGPKAVLPSETAGKWGCGDIELVLNAVRKRIEAHERGPQTGRRKP